MATRFALTLFCALALPAPVGAQVQADVIVAVDCSGSMNDETGMVQAQINNFASAISAVGVDLHVILLSSSSAICVPAPLGSGNCPTDENLPAFRHVLVNVGSNNALQSIINTYGSWSGSVRPAASTTVIVVSDDESALSAAAFDTQFRALNPTFADYRFDSLVCLSLCPFAGGIGSVYLQLSNVTGGQIHDLCDQDFAPDFAAMASGVISTSSSYCTAGTTTHGCTPSISGAGTASASAANGYTITVSGVEGQKLGVIFYGASSAGWIPQPWGGASTSFVCVQSPVQRTGTQGSGGTQDGCDGALSIDWNDFVATNPGVIGSSYVGGEGVCAQGWFRDPPAPKTTNLSNGLLFVVEP